MRKKVLNKYIVSVSLLLLIKTCLTPVAHAATSIHPASGPIGPARTGSAFSQTWSISGLGGSKTVSYWVSDYPAGGSTFGLTFDAATATLSGIPTSTGTSNPFTVTAYISDGSTVSGSYTITVNLGGCSFVSGSNGVMSFSNSAGNIDPSITGSIIGTVTTPVQYICQSGLSYSIAISPTSVSNLTLVSGSNTMSYSLGVVAAGTGLTGTGAPIDVFIPAGSPGNSQLLSNFQILPAGTYTNNAPVQVTISWGTGGNAGQIVAALPIESVSGAIINTCVAPTPGAMTISIDPSSTSANQPFTVTRDATVQCTMNDTIANIQAASLNGIGNTTCDGPAPGNGISGMIMKSASGKTISYTFNCNNSVTGAGFGPGLDQNLGVGGYVTQPNAQAADYDGGNQYSDTVTLTINY